MAAKKGDRIVVESEQVGQPTREGEILEVIEGSVRVRYRVRWADGHESTFSPSVGSARIEPAPRKKKAAPAPGKKKASPVAGKKKAAPAPRKKKAAKA